MNLIHVNISCLLWLLREGFFLLRLGMLVCQETSIKKKKNLDLRILKKRAIDWWVQIWILPSRLEL